MLCIFDEAGVECSVWPLRAGERRLMLVSGQDLVSCNGAQAAGGLRTEEEASARTDITAHPHHLHKHNVALLEKKSFMPNFESLSIQSIL